MLASGSDFRGSFQMSSGPVYPPPPPPPSGAQLFHWQKSPNLVAMAIFSWANWFPQRIFRVPAWGGGGGYASACVTDPEWRKAGGVPGQRGCLVHPPLSAVPMFLSLLFRTHSLIFSRISPALRPYFLLRQDWVSFLSPLPAFHLSSSSPLRFLLTLLTVPFFIF